MEGPSQKLLQEKVSQLKTILGVDFVGLALANENPQHYKQEIRWRYVSGNTSERYKKIVLQVGRGLAGIVWRTGRHLLENDLSQKTAEELLEYPIAIMEGLQSVLVAPIMANDVIIGVVLVGYRQVERINEELIEELALASIELPTLITALREEILYE